MSLRNFIFRTKTGLKPQELDYRDLPVGLLWGFLSDYKPKHKKLVLETREPKNQYANTCGWNASVGMKEIDEKEELSARGNVMAGREMGLISGDGFSNLRDNQKVLSKFGAVPAWMLDENSRKSWDDYSNPKHLTPEMRTAALDRRIKSFLSVNTVLEIYKALDNGRAVEIGVDWYTGWNMSGGFKLPWVVHKIIGYFVGGHALYIKGYDQEYKGQKVFIIRNSYGKSYGDSGDFYLTEDMLQDNISRYGAYINHDLDKDTLKWLQQHQGKNVISNGKIYRIENDTKRHYPDMATFLSHNKADNDFVTVSDDILKEIKDGAAMDFFQGEYYLTAYNIIRRIKDKTAEAEYKKYFNNLF